MAYVRGEPGDRELLEAAFAQIPQGMVVLDRHLRYVAINEALATANGHSVADHVGRSAAEVVPEIWPVVQPWVDRALAGELVVRAWADLWVPRSGDPTPAQATFVPVRVAGDGEEQVAGVVVVVQDVSDQTRLRQQAEALSDLTLRLSSADSPHDLAGAAGRLCRSALGASMCWLVTRDRATGDLAFWPDEALPLPAEDGQMPISDDHVVAEVFRSGEEIVTPEGGAHDHRWREDAAVSAVHGVTASATLPLRIQDKTVGVLALVWDSPRAFDEPDLTFLRAIAARVGTSVERVIASQLAEQAAARAEALLRTAARLNALTDEHGVADLVSSTLVELTGAGEAGLFLLAEGGAALVRVDRLAGLEPERRAKYDRQQIDEPVPLTHAVRTGQPVYLTCPADWALFPGVAADAAAMGWPTVAALPLVNTDTIAADGAPIGAVYAHYISPRTLHSEDRQFLRTVAELAAAALVRIRAEREESRTRQTLVATELRLTRLAQSPALGVGEATETHIVAANQALLDMLGLAELPPGGLDWRSITPAGWEAADADALAQLAVTGAARPFEKEYLRADGTTVPVLLSLAAYGSDPITSVFTVVDLRERKALERRERQALRDREQLSLAVQAALVPRLPFEDAAWDVDVTYRPGDERMALGGDFYDVVTLPGGEMAVVVGDVTGHGPAAAATGSALRAAWRALVMSGCALEELAGHLHAQLVSERDSDMLCATALTALLHADGTVESLAMGHPDPILLNGSAPREVPVDRTLLLGVIPPPQVRLTTFRVPRGNRLLFYTDGLIEGRAAPGAADRFGVDGLLDLLAAGPGQGAATLIDQVAARHGSGLPDDVAVVLLTSPRG